MLQYPRSIISVTSAVKFIPVRTPLLQALTSYQNLYTKLNKVVFLQVPGEWLCNDNPKVNTAATG